MFAHTVHAALTAAVNTTDPEIALRALEQADSAAGHLSASEARALADLHAQAETHYSDLVGGKAA